MACCDAVDSAPGRLSACENPLQLPRVNRN